MTGAAIFRSQGRVLGALILRETRATFGNSQLGYLWAIATPAAGIAILVLIFSAIGRIAPYGPSLVLFFAVGILTLEFFRKLADSLMTAVEANRALLAYPPIRESDVIFARAALICATHAVIMAAFYGALVWIGEAEPPAHPGELMLALAATALFGLGFGLVSLFLLGAWPSWRQVQKILTRPLMFVSGVFYVPSMLPPEAQAVIAWNPVLHAVEWVRAGWYASYPSPILDKSFLLIAGFALTAAGLAGERLSRRSAS